MRQVVQNLKNGKTELRNVPMPLPGRGEVLVATRASLISAGTERMVMDFAGKSLAGKAKERPDLVKKVMTKMRRDGLADTLNSVFARLSEPLPLGYSAAGTVVAVGSDVTAEFKVGDRVAIAGAGQANHAEVNAVPKNLTVKLPDAVPFNHGCYATLGAIALHGVRNAEVKLGDRVLVIGLGLVGQLAVQLAAAAGARVAGIDYNPARCTLAEQGGALRAVNGATGDATSAFMEFTDGRGFDAVLICAATDSDGPIAQAAQWARDRGNVVLVGKVGTTFDYASYMKKELNIRVSRSYGPGRYDPAFEQRGESYPIGFVPWTERENLGEVVRLMAAGKLRPQLLTTHSFSFDKALDAYALVQGKRPAAGQTLGVVLAYPEESRTFETPAPLQPLRKGEVGLSFIGTGAFARGVLLPAIRNMGGWQLRHVISKGGLSAAHVAQTFGGRAGSELAAALGDSGTEAVIIATRHDAHAKQTAAALRAGKHVWVEKPLALTLDDLHDVAAAAEASGRVLRVGFNRRHSPHLVALRAKLAAVAGPKQIHIRVNAGQLEEGWQHSPEGGGRLLGEVCHFTDAALYLAGSPVVTVSAAQGKGQDVYAITLTHADGSVSQVFYTSEGDPAGPKERIEVHGGGGTGLMDNYVTTTWSHGGKCRTLAKKSLLGGLDKGHAAALKAWRQACQHPDAAHEKEAREELVHSSALTLAAQLSIQAGRPIQVGAKPWTGDRAPVKAQAKKSRNR